MILENKADILSKDILTEKFKLLNEGFHPRLVLLGEESYETLREGWLQSIKELPWGDTLMYELEQREDKASVFLSDGTLHELWVVKVNTIEGFKVY